MEKEEGKSRWIKDATKHKGRLHDHLHVPHGEKIPEDKLRAAKNSKNPTIRREAALAVTLKGMGHKKKRENTTRSGLAHSLYET